MIFLVFVDKCIELCSVLCILIVECLLACYVKLGEYIWCIIQGVPKKMSFLGKTAITTFKIIQNAKVWGVLENSGYLLPD